MTKTRRTVLGAVAVALVAAAATVVVVRLREEEPTGLRYAVSVALPDAQRVLWTDWAAVRTLVGARLDAGSSGQDVEAMLDDAFDADLTTTTALESSAAILQEEFGFSPATLQWELYAQATSGNALVMRLGSGVTTGTVADGLRALAYQEPSTPDGSWTRGEDAAPIDPTLGEEVSPVLLNIALLADEGLVLASDRPDALDAAREAVREAASDPVPQEVVEALGSPVAAVLYDGPQVCQELAMGQADPDDQAAGRALVAQAGKVNPITGFGMAVEPDRRVRVVMGFENGAQARTNADTRARLAAGPAPGQGGDFSERFEVDEVAADGDVVRMDLSPLPDQTVLADLTSGPVLFATC